MADDPNDLDPAALGDPWAWQAALQPAVAAGDPEAIHQALAFLEADPYVYWSGYAKEKLASALAQTALSLTQRARARAIVIGCVDGELHCGHPAISRLAGAVADNEMRNMLLVSVRSQSNDALAHRALRALSYIKHPGYNSLELAAARAVAVRHQEIRIARRLWSTEWERELRAAVAMGSREWPGAEALLREIDFGRANRAEQKAVRESSWRPSP